MTLTRDRLVALSRRVARSVSDDDAPLPPVTERWCACRVPVPASLYLTVWQCRCGAPIESRRQWIA